MATTKKYLLERTSRNTARGQDIVLESPNKKSIEARQIVRPETIVNSRNPDNSVKVAVIHERAETGKWNTKYTDLRRIELGESIRIQLDTYQTKQLFETLCDYYRIGPKGVYGEKRKIFLSLEDVPNVSMQGITQQRLAEKILSELNPEEMKILLRKKNALRAALVNLPMIRIDILEELRSNLFGLLGEGEEKIQAWLDKDPKIRCLVFGLEFIDYKREVSFGNSRFDILTEQTGAEHVIIELKSPSVDVFSIKETETKNGLKEEYALSESLSEAIPQIIKYFHEYERENEETFRKNGIEKKQVSKGIIIIGRSNKDGVWQAHFNWLRQKISGIEILTYDHLLEKMDRQMSNLKSLDDVIDF